MRTVPLIALSSVRGACWAALTAAACESNEFDGNDGVAGRGSGGSAGRGNDAGESGDGGGGEVGPVACPEEIGGLADESAGKPVRVTGKVVGAVEAHGSFWVSVGFGHGNVVVISRYLTQILYPEELKGPGFTVEQFEVIAIKSRVHFRRGFDDSGFAKTILLVEPVDPYLGTVRLDGLPYKNVDLKKFYPYGDVSFP